MMPVQLRGHHFLCILTYRGYGYTPAFVANMSAIVADIGKGRPVRLAEGPDDICKALTVQDRIACNHDCGKADTRELDRMAVDEVGHLLGIDLAGPLELTRTMVESLRLSFTDRSIRSACRRCPWSEFCTEIAAEGFSDTKLFAPRT
ncbi:DUF1284 domain-containing protein [Rhizobium sp.]